MNRTGFILAVEPFLIRKGLGAVLNRIPGIIVIKEFDAAPPLMDYLKNPFAGYLVVSQSIFNHITELYITDSRLLERTILVTDLPGKPQAGVVRAFIHTGEGKEIIVDKIREILDSQLDQPSYLKTRELTRREKTILRLVSMGLTNKQIAGQLYLSAHTVITHRKNIIGKLGIKSVSGLTIYAIVNNIITIEELTSKADQ